MMEFTLPVARRLLLVAGIVCVGLAGALMVVVGQARTLADRLRQAEQSPAPPPVVTTVANTKNEKLLQQLLDERTAAYARLRADYEALKKDVDDPQAPTASAKATDEDAAGVATNRVAWLERLRTQDPFRYKQIQDERARRGQLSEPRFQEQLNRLDERLQAATAEDEANLVNEIAATVAKLDELRQQWQQVRELPEAERRAAAQQLAAESRAAYEKLTELRAQDRQLQLQQLATDVGYHDQTGIDGFVEDAQRIYNETDTNPMRFMGMGRGWGRGPPPAQPAPAAQP